MRALLDQYCARNQVPGVAVSAFDRNGVTSMACSGVTDVESRAPLTPSTMFRIYSVSKLLTSCAVVQLARKHELDLDTRMSAHVHELSRRRGRSKDVATVRQSLSHSGGTVPDALTWAPLNRNADDLRPDVVRDYVRAFRFAAPGRHYSYSNAGFNLSAVLIEELTGKPYAEAMRTLLFDPLGMAETTHDPALAMTYPLAQHHTLVGDEPQVIHRPLVGSKWVAGSQCYSTLSDMAAFGVWLLRDLRSTPDDQPRIDRPEADLRLDVGTHYGLGCYLTPTADGKTVVGHEGFFQGMWSKLVIDPAGDRGMVWLDNRGDELRDRRYALIEDVMPGLLPPTSGHVAPLRCGDVLTVSTPPTTWAPTAESGPPTFGWRPTPETCCSR